VRFVKFVVPISEFGLKGKRGAADDGLGEVNLQGNRRWQDVATVLKNPPWRRAEVAGLWLDLADGRVHGAKKPRR
jgi:hypothetical protein